MKCPKCNQEIEDNSVFCEYCGEKTEEKHSDKTQQDTYENVKTENTKHGTVFVDLNDKSKRKYLLIGAGVLLLVLVFLIIHIVVANRASSFRRDIAWVWPNCQGGSGTIYVLQNSEGTKLVQLKSDVFYSYQTILSYEIWYNGKVKIYKCEGDHSGMAAFAALHPDGTVDFILNYDKGGLFSHEGNVFCVYSDVGYTDEAHLFGSTDDIQCGESLHNVKNLFNQTLQPVMLGDKWYYCDVNNTINRSLEYDDAYPFCYGLARVMKNGSWHYINTRGEELQIKEAGLTIVEAGDFVFDEEKQAPSAYVELSGNGVYVTGRIDIMGNITIVTHSAVAE